MKVCSACQEELPQGKFSSKQWKQKRYHRRCKDCVAANKDAQSPKPPPKEEDEGPSCWICLQEGTDDDGSPLRPTGCSCRGTNAGYAHLPCLVAYAEHKFVAMVESGRSKFSMFTNCPTCKQLYQGRMANHMADALVSLVNKKYPTDTGDRLLHMQKRVWAYGFKHACRRSTKNVDDLSELKQAAKAVISRAEEMKEMGLVDAGRWAAIQTGVCSSYRCLGYLALNEGTKMEPDLESALRYYNKCREIYESNGNTRGLLSIDTMIAEAKAKCSGKNVQGRADMTLSHHVKEYEYLLEKRGEENNAVLLKGNNLAKAYRDTGQVIAAEKLLSKNLATSLRVHGNHHVQAIQIALLLNEIQTRKVIPMDDPGIKRIIDEGGSLGSKAEYFRKESFQALRYENDGENLVVQGPLLPKDLGAESPPQLATDFYYTYGTPVIVNGGGKMENINGKIGEIRDWEPKTNKYEIHFEDRTLNPCLVSAKHIRILFEVPGVLHPDRVVEILPDHLAKRRKYR